jgi:hypothetical protein
MSLRSHIVSSRVASSTGRVDAVAGAQPPTTSDVSTHVSGIRLITPNNTDVDSRDAYSRTRIGIVTSTTPAALDIVNLMSPGDVGVNSKSYASPFPDCWIAGLTVA